MRKAGHNEPPPLYGIGGDKLIKVFGKELSGNKKKTNDWVQIWICGEVFLPLKFNSCH
jgi:hypothetical protein